MNLLMQIHGCKSILMIAITLRNSRLEGQRLLLMKLYSLNKELHHPVAQLDKTTDPGLFMTMTPLGLSGLRSVKGTYGSLLSCKPSSDSNHVNPNPPLPEEWWKSSQHKRTLVLLGGNDLRRNPRPLNRMLTYSNHLSLRHAVQHLRPLRRSLPRDLRQLLYLRGRRLLHEMSLQYRKRLLHLPIVIDKRGPRLIKEATMLLRMSPLRLHSLCCLTSIQSTLPSSATAQ